MACHCAGLTRAAVWSAREMERLRTQARRLLFLSGHEAWIWLGLENKQQVLWKLSSSCHNREEVDSTFTGWKNLIYFDPEKILRFGTQVLAGDAAFLQ